MDDGFEEDELPKPLSIGIVFGGGPTPWKAVLTDLGRRVEVARRGVESPLHLNVVFHVPGRFLQPEGEYVRAGTFDPSRRLLMVQATMPQAAPDDSAGFALGRLKEAVDCAEAWALRRGIPDDLSALRLILERVGA